jgi:hypothetical protein
VRPLLEGAAHFMTQGDMKTATARLQHAAQLHATGGTHSDIMAKHKADQAQKREWAAHKQATRPMHDPIKKQVVTNSFKARGLMERAMQYVSSQPDTAIAMLKQAHSHAPDGSRIEAYISKAIEHAEANGDSKMAAAFMKKGIEEHKAASDKAKSSGQKWDAGKVA